MAVDDFCFGALQVCVASIFRSETRFATFEVFQREAKSLLPDLKVEGYV
jgi:hypothetical protein